MIPGEDVEYPKVYSTVFGRYLLGQVIEYGPDSKHALVRATRSRHTRVSTEPALPNLLSSRRHL